jgi:hypothetical protein
VAHGRRKAPLWTGRLSSRRLAGWAQRQALPGRIRIVRAPGAPRRRVVLFTVQPGDRPVSGGERAELAASRQATGGYERSEAWYAWSTYFPRDLNPLAAHTWNVFTQWHGTAPDHCSPDVALQVNTRPRPPRIRLAVRGGALARSSCAPQATLTRDTVALALGRWYDFALHVRWSADPRTGFVELAVNGRVVVPRIATATLYAGQGVYLKQGFYRGPSAATSHIYHGGVTRFR